MKLFALLAFSTTIGGLLFPAAKLAPVPHATVIGISSSTGNFTEPGIALDPNHPSRIVAVYQGGSNAQGQGGAVYSSDTGRHFAASKATALSDWRVVGDVTATFDNKGNVFWCYLAFDHLGTPFYWAHGATRNGIFVRRSGDGGKTWGPGVAVKAFTSRTEPVTVFEDEPRIFADLNPHSSQVGNLYVGWVEWQQDGSVILFSRSTDAGQTWSSPQRIDTHAGLPRDDNGSLGGFMLSVRPDGTLDAIWADGNHIVLAQSDDGGRTFRHPKAVIETAPPYFKVPEVGRCVGFPQIAFAPSEIHGGGHLYISWSDYRNGDVDVFLSSSSDNGRNWLPPVRVNDDLVHDGVDQFFQAMTVDPVTGVIYLVFYDRRQDPLNRKLTITLARSDDAGRSFHNYAWTDSPWSGQDAFLGDYTWIAAYDNRVYAAWTERVQQSKNIATKVLVGSADFSQPSHLPARQ